MSTPQSIIPPEIIDHVFSFLQSDPTTLATCSRAHPDLSPIAERLLYADIVVFDDNKSNLDANVINKKKKDRQIFLAAEFHKLLIDSPHVADYVRKLKICLFSWSATGVAPILPMLMRLEGIFITAAFYENWSNLSEEFRAAFVDRLSSPLSFLKEVSINYFDYFPLDIFDSCPTVKHIGLHRRTRNDVQDVHHDLESLSLRSWQPRDSGFKDWARKRVHGLQFLLFHSSDSESINVVLPELLRMCSSSLKSLQVNLSDGSRYGTTCVDLSSVPYLKELTIRSNMHHHGTRYSCAFAAIIQVLETTPHLNHLTLKFGNGLSGTIEAFNLMDWSPLLAFLTRSSSDKFRHIEIQLCHNSLRNPEAGNFIPSIDTLPQLYESEIVLDLIAKGVLDICMREWELY